MNNTYSVNDRVRVKRTGYGITTAIVVLDTLDRLCLKDEKGKWLCSLDAPIVENVQILPSEDQQ